ARGRDWLPLAVALMTAGLLTSVSPGHAAARARLANSRTPSPGPTGICSKGANGRVVNCPRPVAPALLPAAARKASLVTSAITSPATYLDTRTWTSGGGNTYPGAQWPFGMVQWSPDTSPHRADGGGYTYGDTRLIGYSLTHLSGPGC